MKKMLPALLAVAMIPAMAIAEEGGEEIPVQTEKFSPVDEYNVVPPESPLKVTQNDNGFHVLSFDKEAGSFVFEDVALAGDSVARRYTYSVDGVTADSRMFRNTEDDAYVYCALVDDNTCNSTLVKSAVIEAPNGGVVSVPEFESIVAAAKEAGYLKFRISVDEVSAQKKDSEDFYSLYENTIALGETKNAAKISYFNYYRLPTTGANGDAPTLFLYKESKDGVLSEELTEQKLDYAQVRLSAGDTVWFATELKSADTIYQVRNEYKFCRYGEKDVVECTEWEANESKNDVRVNPANNQVTYVSAPISAPRLSKGDSIFYSRIMVVTKLSDNLGEAVMDTTYTSEVTVAPLYQQIVSADTCGKVVRVEGSVETPIEDADTVYVGSGKSVSYKAVADSACRLVGWFNADKSTKVTANAALSLVNKQDTALVAVFEPVPFTMELTVLNGKQHNKSIFVAAGDSAIADLDHVLGLDKSRFNVRNYSGMGDLFRTFALGNEKDGFTVIDSVAFGKDVINPATKAIFDIDAKGVLTYLDTKATYNLMEYAADSKSMVQVCLYAFAEGEATDTLCQVATISWKNAVSFTDAKGKKSYEYVGIAQDVKSPSKEDLKLVDEDLRVKHECSWVDASNPEREILCGSPITNITDSMNFVLSSKTSYYVAFKDYNDSLLSGEYVEAGTIATAPAVPNHGGDVNYVFEGWSSKNFGGVVSDSMTVKAVYSYIGPEIPSKDKDAIISLNKLASFKVSVRGRNVMFSGARLGDKVAVFDMQGRVISLGTVNAANFTVAMPRAGQYMARIGGSVVKFDVR